MNSARIENWGLHWFRRDLRLQGNPALIWNSDRHQGRVLGIFFFDSRFSSEAQFSHSRFAFFIDTLSALRDDMRKSGGDLLVLDAVPQLGFPAILNQIKHHGVASPSVVTFNRDYEPFARERDATITQLLEKDLQIPVYTDRDHLLIEPHELTKPDGNGFYQIYTPFSRRWFDLLKKHRIHSRIQDSTQVLAHSYSTGSKCLEALLKIWIACKISKIRMPTMFLYSNT